MSRRGYEGNEYVGEIVVKGVSVDIYGAFYKDTGEDCFDFYDLYVDGECINLGEPLWEYPTPDDVLAFIELQEVLNND